MAQLSVKDERIADLFASGYKVSQIAAETAASVQTVYRRLQNPLVRARIAEARAAVLRPIRDIVVKALERNIAVLEAIRDNPDEGSRNRIAAAAEIRATFGVVEPVSEESPLRAQLEAVLSESENPEPSNED